MVECLYLMYYKKIYNKATINVNKLILTPFSPFDIKCKHLMWKEESLEMYF